MLWFLLNNAVTAFTLLAQARPSSGRPLTVRDVLAAEELGDVRVAPDGETLAIVVKRARLVGERYHTGPLWYYHRGDVWIASSRGASIRNITNGGRDAAGYWNPVWSPDSKRLAMLSNRGGDIARLYVWHSAASAPFQVADGAVDIDVEFRADGMPIGPIAWLDARRLLCMLRSTIDDPDMTILAASRAWAKAEGGREPTASVIDTYVGTLAQREVLAIIDVTTRQIDTVTVTQPFALTPQPNQPRIVDIAPNRRIAAWIAQSGEVRRSAEVPVRYGDAAGPLRLGMVSLQPGSVVQWFDQIEPWFGGVYNPRP